MATTSPRHITPALVRDALSAIPPNIDREGWVRLAMAVKSELGAEGFEVWDAWSQQADNYSSPNARSTWRSVKAGGGVGIGTLFQMAKEHGFSFPAEPANPAVLAHAQAQDAERVAKRREEQAREAEAYRERADKARQAAAELWREASESGLSPYLRRKGVQGYGVRYLRDGTVLVPLCDAAGQLQNLQRIAPAKPTDEEEAKGRREKRFLPGGRKKGLWHAIGGAVAPGAGVGGVRALLVAEGYATAATLHEALGRPVAVAFDAGNLAEVAVAVAALHPHAVLLICGDDDTETLARTGKNPGREKAEATARKLRAAGVRAAAVLPVGLPEGGSDFNDLAAHAGLAEVKRQVHAALVELMSPPALAAANAAPAGVAARQARDKRQPSDEPQHSGDPSGQPDPFTVTAQGIWFTARDAEGNAKRPQWVCAPIEVSAQTRNEDANGWGFLLRFADPDGRPKSWAMPSAMLSGDGSEWAARLRDMGFQIAPGARARNLLQQYIDTRKPAARVTCTERVGWHGGAYVLPSLTLGETGEQRYVFQSEGGMEDTFRQRGTLADWQHSVARLCAGNTRMVFAVCVSLAGPLLRIAGLESGGIHLLGDSSEGKSTALRLAASVWGRPSFMQSWRSTSNALEATAAQHSDCTLILDEVGQLDGREAGEVAYMLANDQEKGRSHKTGFLRKRRTWRLLFLSSGEVSLADHMAEAGKRTRAGQEVRMVSVPLNAGRGMGGLEELHGRDKPAHLADELTAAAAASFGTAGRTWLEWLCEHHAELGTEALAEQMDRHLASMVPEAAAAQVGRVARRFAIVATAGEMATAAGVTGWRQGEASKAALACFNAWLAARGHLNNGEEAAMLAQVRRFVEAHSDGRMTWWHRADDDHAPKTLNRAGFRRLVDKKGNPINMRPKIVSDPNAWDGHQMVKEDGLVEFVLLPEVFKQEVCAGYRWESVATMLRERGYLKHEQGRLTQKHRLPGIGASVNCFHLRAAVLGEA